MKTLCWILCVLFGLFTLSGLITWGLWDWTYQKNFNYALKLCDDASLPEMKVKYLKEYKEKISKITSKSRYIFMTPDLELEKQIGILDGLIERLEDVAKMKPSELGYQQGMYQLSGQEIDHQLERIRSIFYDAKIRQNFFIFFMCYFSWWIFGIVTLVFGMVAYGIDEY